MEKQNGEQIEVDSQAVATESKSGETETEISLGKFKDVSALLGAYNSLQAEFTKRCQRIKELEGKAAFDNNGVVVTETGEKESITRTENILNREQIIKDYLKGLLEGKQKAIVMESGGVRIKTPSEKPKSIAEAGMLAKELLKK